MPYFRHKSEKLSKRSLEPLLLLDAINHPQGERDVPDDYLPDSPRQWTPTIMRRHLLNQLCIVCEFEKGGSATSAMALTDEPSGPLYWLACPTGTESKIEPFLQSTLKKLHEIANHGQGETYAATATYDLFVIFARFGRQRLRKTWKLLQRAVQNELAEPKDLATRAWLSRCHRSVHNEEKLLQFCRWAYQERKSEHLSKLDPTSTHPRAAFSVRHYIGRMASVYRAAVLLVKICPRLGELFEDFELRVITNGPDLPSPGWDEWMTLEGIARRMIPADDDAQYTRVVDALHALDRLSPERPLETRIKDILESNTFKLKVHAEAALLDALHRQSPTFYEGDKFIACSKPACFCCYHYFRVHPGTFVVPHSSNNRWIAWRVPDLPDPENARAAQEQRAIINKLTVEFRKAAIKQVLDKSGRRHMAHPDSITGITPTLTQSAVDAASIRSEESTGVLEEAFQALDLESTDQSFDFKEPSVEIVEETETETEPDGGVSLIG